MHNLFLLSLVPWPAQQCVNNAIYRKLCCAKWRNEFASKFTISSSLSLSCCVKSETWSRRLSMSVHAQLALFSYSRCWDSYLFDFFIAFLPDGWQKREILPVWYQLQAPRSRKVINHKKIFYWNLNSNRHQLCSNAVEVILHRCDSSMQYFVGDVISMDFIVRVIFNLEIENWKTHTLHRIVLQSWKFFSTRCDSAALQNVRPSKCDHHVFIISAATPSWQPRH